LGDMPHSETCTGICDVRVKLPTGRQRNDR
jgi:hypothetical protein